MVLVLAMLGVLSFSTVSTPAFAERESYYNLDYLIEQVRESVPATPEEALQTAGQYTFHFETELSPDADRVSKQESIQEGWVHKIDLQYFLPRTLREWFWKFVSPRFVSVSELIVPKPISEQRVPALPVHQDVRQRLWGFARVHRAMHRVFSDALKDPDYSDKWTVVFRDKEVPILIRKWVAVSNNPYEMIWGVQSLEAEVEFRGEDGEPLVSRVPISLKSAKRRKITLNSDYADWEKTANTKIAERRRPGAWVYPKMDFIDFGKEGSDLLHVEESAWFEEHLFQMQQSTYGLHAWSRKQIRELPRAGGVDNVYVASVQIRGAWTPVAYLIARKHAGYAELLSVGCHKAYENLGVQEQLLTSYFETYKNTYRYIVSSLPREQHSLLQSVGYAPWPEEGAVRVSWRNWHQGHLLNGSIQRASDSQAGFVTHKRNSVFFVGSLPDWVQLDSTEANRTVAQDFDVLGDIELAPSDESLALVDFDDSYGTALEDEEKDNFDDDMDDLTFGEVPEILKTFRTNAELLSDLDDAKTKSQKAAMLQRLKHSLNQQDVTTALKVPFWHPVSFYEYRDYLKIRLETLALSRGMIALVESHLGKAQEKDGEIGEYETKERLADLLNELRSATQSNGVVAEVNSAVRVAKYFVENHRFPLRIHTIPNWKLTKRQTEELIDPAVLSAVENPEVWKMRSGTGSLRPESVPPADAEATLPEEIENVLLVVQHHGAMPVLKEARLISKVSSPALYYSQIEKERDEPYCGKELFQKHLWLIDHAKQGLPLQLIPPDKVFSLPLGQGIRDLARTLPVTPLYFGHFLIAQATHFAKQLYVVLKSADPEFDQLVVNPFYLEPVRGLYLARDRADLPGTELNCALILQNFKRVVATREAS